VSGLIFEHVGLNAAARSMSLCAGAVICSFTRRNAGAAHAWPLPPG